jgi:hypothetical protein
MGDIISFNFCILNLGNGQDIKKIPSSDSGFFLKNIITIAGGHIGKLPH